MGAFVPFTQFVLKVHSRCDLACDHCYMYEHADQSWRARPRVMSSATVAKTAMRIAEHVRAHGLTRVCVVLHGGEPLLAGSERLEETILALRAALGGLCDVDTRIQTNGLQLDDRFCALFSTYGVKVGISLDGDRASNDRHRRYADGRGSYEPAIRAVDLMRRRIPELFSGLLCTIDVRNDPVTVYRELIAHQPPAIDFLLPHATWDNPPLRPSETAYADWLIRVFRAWQADGMPLPVRIFDSVIRTSHGGGTLTESLGLEPIDLVVVETDGAVEQADSLKTAYDGAPATGFNVFAHTFDEVAEYPGIIARQRGLATLAEACQECPVVSSCGGGLYAHRYRTGSGFANPSVYCADLLKLIKQIRSEAEKPVHFLPGQALDDLASGYGGAEAIESLAGMQETLRRALLASIPEEASTAAAWSVINRVDREDRESLNAVLAYPYVRVWAVRCLRGEAEAADLSAVAASAAIRAGLDAQLRLPVRAGMVHLPMIGSWQVEKTADTIPIEISGGAYQLPRGSVPVPLRRLHAGEITVVLDDLDPFRDCYEWPAASRLNDREFNAWQETFREAWALIKHDYPAYGQGLAAGLTAIVPLAAAEPGHHVSATARDAFGSVAIRRPADPAVLALLIIHEFQHVKLGAMLDTLDLHHAADTDLYYAPWRNDPRPLEGLLQGAYAHIAVTDYWRVRRRVLAGGRESVAADAAFAQWRQQAMAAIDTLSSSGSLTAVGNRFVAGMRATVTGWLGEPVPALALEIAAESARRHRSTWLKAHGGGAAGAVG
jgi:uncharacterized protein